MQVTGHRTGHDGRVVPVGAQYAARIGRVSGTNHVEQALRLVLAVDDPARVEYLVPAVLGIGLRKHHQFGVGGIPPLRAKLVSQVTDFVGRQGQAEFRVRALQRSKLATLDDVPAEMKSKLKK